MLAGGLIGFFIDLKEILIAQKKSIFIPQLFIGVIIVVLGIAAGGLLLVNTSKVYQDAIDNIKKDEMLKSEIGTINGIGLFPSGSGFMDFAYRVSEDPSTFIVTVSGSNAIKEIEITLYKNLPVEE